MNEREYVRSKVKTLYAQKNPNRAEWADWLYEHHVLVVARKARQLAENYGADIDLSEAAALLHDIADVEMGRHDDGHEAKSLEIARSIMGEAGYTEDTIARIVDDAIRYHSCRGTERPRSKEGLVLATADSLAHLQTDFYIYAVMMLGKNRALGDIKAWVLKKIDRDFQDKISFDAERESARPDYEMIKTFFSR